MNTLKWLKELSRGEKAGAIPLLTFPATELIGESVLETVRSAELQARAMTTLAERTPSAAAVSFMDLSVEAECFGAQIVFHKDKIPEVKGIAVSGQEQVSSLDVPAVGSARSGIYIEAVRLALEGIKDRPVLAGVIGPFTLAARLMGVSEIMMECYDDPDTVYALLEKTSEFIISYCKAYKDIGAHGAVLAEPVAGLLSPALVREFSEPYVKRIVSEVQDDSFALVYHNCGDNIPRILDSVLETGAAAYHFGNAVDMEEIVRALPDGEIAMGNIDPVRAFCGESPEYIYGETQKLLERCAPSGKFILSSGCDIPHGAKWENIDAFYRALKDFNNKK